MSKHMYILADGGRIAASDPSEFVRVLREGSWFDSGCTDGQYIHSFYINQLCTDNGEVAIGYF